MSARESDTNERLDDVEEELEELRRQQTPPMGSFVITKEDVRTIAKEVEKDGQAARREACWKEGPAHVLKQEIDAMDRRLKLVEAGFTSLSAARQNDEDSVERDRKRKSTNFRVAVGVLTLTLGGLTLLNGYLSRQVPSAQGAEMNAAILRQLNVLTERLDAARSAPQRSP